MRSFSGSARERVLVGDRAPQERGDGLFLDLLQPRGDAGLAEIFLRQHVGRDLRPERRHLDVVRLEHHRAVGVADLGRGQPEFDLRVGRLTVLGEMPFDPHSLPLWAPKAWRKCPPNISRRRVFCQAHLSGAAHVNRVGPVLCLTSPSPPAPSGTGPLTAVDPPLRTRTFSARAESPAARFEPCLGAFAGHLVLAPAEHPNARTSSAARQAVAGESESNAKCGGGAVNSGDGIGCSTGSIGDSERIRQGRLSQSFRCGCRGAVMEPDGTEKRYRGTVVIRMPEPSRSGSRGKIAGLTVSWYRKSQKAAWLNGESQSRVRDRFSCRRGAAHCLQ